MQQVEQAVLLSIRPEFVDRIVSGEKRFEFRRSRPVRLRDGTLLLVYCTVPRGALVAVARVRAVLESESAEQLWSQTAEAAGISAAAFHAYFSGAERCVAIELESVESLVPVPLAALREAWPGFQPPQGHHYAEVDAAANEARRGGGAAVRLVRRVADDSAHRASA